MAKKHGYYIAVVPGVAKGDVIVYWDGKSFLTVGNDSKSEPDEFLCITAEPINTGESTAEFCGGEEWLKAS